ncbi:hypothetical protein BGX33_007641 [Mortierella sp. NVP41]|nr:hypothetical protein BGX33_007641 [Mortierella sp. NVP41]
MHEKPPAEALVKLLCLNKHISSVAVSHLYSEPYKLPYSTCTTQTPTISTPYCNYLVYVRRLHLEDWSVERGDYWPIQPNEQKFNQGQEFEHMHMCRMDRIPPTYVETFKSKEELLRRCHQALLFREATWALASSILEQLQSISIPLSGIRRYIGVIDRFKRLEYAHFVMDEPFDYHGAGPDESTRSRKEEAMCVLIQFAQEHQRLFPGCLRRASTSDSGMWPDAIQACPKETELALVQILPPLERPEYLTKLNWPQFAAHPLSIPDLRFVEKLHNKTSPDKWFDTSCDYEQLLQRCRSLSELDIISPGPGIFKWAVKEKKKSERLVRDRNLRRNNGEGMVRSTEDDLKYGLVPLKVVTLHEGSTQFTDEIDDIAFPFSDTLSELSVCTSRLALDGPRPFHVGRGFVYLPLLTRLDFQRSLCRLLVHEDLFDLCPNLVFVNLDDLTNLYECEDIVPCFPADLDILVTLRLSGWSALTFHPDTLHSTKDLKYFDIGLYYDDYEGCYIPPLQELNLSYGIEDDSLDIFWIHFLPTIIRPQWTWDWYLPQMLQGCPELRELSLLMYTFEDPVSRAITHSNLFAPRIGPIDHDDNDRNTPAPEERILMHNLTKLRMEGNWTMDDAVLLAFLPGMFPNLKEMKEVDWLGATLKGLVKAFRVVKTLEKVTTTSQRKPSAEEMEEFGMCLEDEGLDKEKVLPVSIAFREEEDHSSITKYRLLL